MGVVVHKQQDRDTELNRQINANLRARAVAASEVADPDLVEGSDYTRNTKKTGRFAWVWFVLIALALVSLVVIVTI